MDLDKCFAKDSDQYYQLGLDYLSLTTDNIDGAYELTKRSWDLSSRWSNLQADSGKIAKMHGLTKTDLSTLCQQRYRQCHLIHEHCRMIWRLGTETLRSQPNR